MADPAAAESGALKIESIGIIGAGQMGGGIAHVCALAGYPVKISDVSDAMDDEKRKRETTELLAVLDTLHEQMDRGLVSINAKAGALTQQGSLFPSTFAVKKTTKKKSAS